MLTESRSSAVSVSRKALVAATMAGVASAVVAASVPEGATVVGAAVVSAVSVVLATVVATVSAVESSVGASVVTEAADEFAEDSLPPHEVVAISTAVIAVAACQRRRRDMRLFGVAVAKAPWLPMVWWLIGAMPSEWFIVCSQKVRRSARVCAAPVSPT